MREAGFGAVRIPKAYGGLGATIPQLFRLLLELAEADSNVSHLFRGHFSFLEARLNIPDPSSHARWFPQIAQGIVLGYAMAERTEHTGGSAKLIHENGEYFVDGTKYYSTGTIYADWIIVTLLPEGEELGERCRAGQRAPGVTRLDDWDGFGQRLTGSGTTRFDRVRIGEDQIIRRFGPNDFAPVLPKSRFRSWSTTCSPAHRRAWGARSCVTASSSSGRARGLSASRANQAPRMILWFSA